MDFADIIKELLNEKVQETSSDNLSWTTLCKSLLQEERHDTSTLSELSNHLNECILSLINSKPNKNSRFIKGILERPFYLAFVEMLKNCFENNGEFPQSVKTSQVHMLENVNLARMKEIEEEMKRIINSWNGFPLFLIIKDYNTFLGLRTTLGSATQSPPSLIECINSFTLRHVKSNAKSNRSNISNTLTVGAKAFSKHCHRDISRSFWGICSGTEKQKNEQANQILAKIIANAAWVNLHSLPHDTRVFEVRTSDGYGARWEIWEPKQMQSYDDSKENNDDDSNEPKIIFRGFLEPQMVDGHSKGWIH
ncbi:4302_t:CDS:2 [Diversispora eburnea]|uniref:4302_t:CDS:1 n=1 Tax=Diversispora eburnea TaxID=1213867 RepID=A0A9N8Z179_9GLOM|nr:4302_t:CDS:2 [Diversispora eburnea]